MPFVPSDQPLSFEVVQPHATDPVILPHGKLFAHEVGYWQRVRAKAEERQDHGVIEMATLMESGLMTIIVGRLALERLRSAPQLLTAQNPALALWHDDAVVQLAGSRMLRGFGVEGKLQSLEGEDGEPAEALPPLDSGIEIFHRHANVARLAIHASEDTLGSRGLTPLIRNGVSWFRHDDLGIIVEVKNPAIGTSTDFRRSYKRLNRRAFNPADHFTVEPHLTLSTWSRVYR